MTAYRWLTRRAVAAVVAVLIAGSAAAVFAAGPQRGRHAGGFDGFPPLRMMAVALDLTDAQQQQIKSVLDSHKTEFQQIAQRSRAARQQVQAAVNASDVNEQAIRSAVNAQAQVQADGAVLRARVRQEVFATLTPEQRAKAEQLRSAMHGGRGRQGGPAANGAVGGGM